MGSLFKENCQILGIMSKEQLILDETWKVNCFFHLYRKVLAISLGIRSHKWELRKKFGRFSWCQL